MVTGIVVPSSTKQPLRTAEFNDLTDYHVAVGGYIEIVQLQDHPLVIIANEEGKLKRLRVNRRASCLWWLLNPAGMGGDILLGDVIIAGAVMDGEITDAPSQLVQLLLETKQYQVKVQLSEQLDTWVPIGEPVDEFFEATIRALRLMEVWSPPTAVRVVAAE